MYAYLMFMKHTSQDTVNVTVRGTIYTTSEYLQHSSNKWSHFYGASIETYLFNFAKENLKQLQPGMSYIERASLNTPGFDALTISTRDKALELTFWQYTLRSEHRLLSNLGMALINNIFTAFFEPAKKQINVFLIFVSPYPSDKFKIIPDSAWSNPRVNIEVSHVYEPLTQTSP
jgi:hypothetical protein